VKEFFSFISPDTAKLSQRIHKGDLLFSGSGETAEDIATCVAYLGNEEAYAGGDVLILSPEDYDSLFLAYLMNLPSTKRQKAQLSHGEVIVHINATSLGSIELLMPPKDEQIAIATILSEMDSEIDALKAQKDKYALIKNGLLQQLLTGRVQIR
jgi:type I restriction enzyme S subunit